jgi:PKD repeat protein
MKRLLYLSAFALTVVFFAAGESHACNAAPSAVICGDDPCYVGRAVQVHFDGSCSGDVDGSIVLYEWDLDEDGEFGEQGETGVSVSRTYYSAGSYEVELRVKDDDGAYSDPCDSITVHAVTLEVDVPASYPAWVHVGHSLALGCTVTPSDLGGSYHWSQEIGPGTMTFSPSESDDDPSFSADKRGVYRADVEYTIGDLTLTDGTHNMYVVEVELFRDQYYQQRLNDWPAEGGLSQVSKVFVWQE